MSNLIQIGLDVTSFSEDKKKAINEFISLFEKLDIYSEKVYSPVLGGGLLEFNKSVSETNKVIDEMNAKLASLDTSIKNIQSSASNTAKSQTELSLAVQEYKKQVDNAAKLNAKLSVTTSEQAKENAALKLQLSETTKALLEEAKANNASIQSKEAAKEATRELKEEELQRISALKAEVAIEEGESIEAKRALTAQERELKEERLQMVAAMKAEIAIEEQDEAAKALEEKKAKDLANDYRILTVALKEQAAAYQLVAASKGVNSPEAKAQLSQYRETQNIVSTIDNNLNSASGKAKLFGGALSGAFSQLRNIAYILPGIGIAGLFNLAFVAIEAVADELGIFNSHLIETEERNKKINDSYVEQISLLNQIHDTYIKTRDARPESLKTKEKETDLLSARGVASDIVLPSKIKNAKELIDSLGGVDKIDESLKGMINDLSSSDVLLSDLASSLENINHLVNAKDEGGLTDRMVFKHKKVDGKYNADSEKDNKAIKDDIESKIKLEQSKNSELLKNIKQLQDAKDNLSKLSAEYDRYNSEQERKSFIERRKSELSVTIDTNSKIADSDLSTQNEKLKSINAIKNAQIELNSLTRISVNGTKNNVNLSSSENEKQTAIIKEGKENINVISDFHKREDAINKDFYQRALKAEKESGDTEIRERSRLHKESYENDKLSLEQRLEAYYNYVSDLKVLQEREYLFNIKQGQVKDGGRVSLTSGQIEVENKKKAEQQSSIEASAQNDIQQIVTSSSKILLKQVLDNNRLEEEDNRRSHAQELEDLARSFKNKQLSYKQYNEEIIKTNKKFKKQGLESDVQNDIQELDRLKTLRAENNSSLQKDQESFNKEEDAVKKKRLQGKIDGETESQKNIDIAILSAQEKLGKDSLDLADLNAKKIKEINKQIADEKKAIIEELFNLSKSAIDSQYEREIANIEKAREVKNQDYDKEISAINQSSLSLKDKQALEVQLKEKKIEDDKKAQQEERKLKRENAEIDRALTVAHIIWNTAEAVTAALKMPPPGGEILAIERGILGAAQIGTVLATKIPSFAEGTDYFEGGFARYGEAGPELVKEPYKSPYLVMKETISYLPKGTEIIPMKDNVSFGENKVDNSWEQTRWLARQIKKQKQEIKNSFNPTINIDLSFELYKNKLLGN